jgi:uncharacterized repeat protein (TIGR01451 family)
LPEIKFPAMRKAFLTFILFVSSFLIQAQEPFVTTWEVNTMIGLDIIIPTSGNGYNYTIDFGDGTMHSNVTGDIMHEYSSPGVYTVSITGDFPRIRFRNFNSNSKYPKKIKSIEQWGDIEWNSMESAFYLCSNLWINATDVPDLSQATNLSYAFYEIAMVGSSISNWDVSTITNLSHTFYRCDFNQPLNNWDVSNVTDISYLFTDNNAFNHPLDNWDVSNVTNMAGTFSRCYAFNQSLENWDVSNVTIMDGLFSWTGSFNQPLDNWDVSNVVSMAGMFSNSGFNQSLENWDVSNVANMSSMFNNSAFNQPIENWDVSNVVSMNGMFSNSGFNQSLENWDVSNVENMSSMFVSNYNFNQPLNNWDVSNVKNMDRMFQNTYYNQPLYNWDVSNVIHFTSMFRNAYSFNQNISSWQINSWNLLHFLSDSGMDINNYDTFLNKLVLIGTNEGVLGAENLEYCNQDMHDYLINDLGWMIVGDDLYPNCNSIYGTVLYDFDNNGCNVNDIPVNGLMITANDGVLDFSTFVYNGNYELGTYGTSFTVSTTGIPEYFTVTPESVNVVFSGSNTEEVNFCLTANQSVEDLNITILPVNEARPGFESDYRLVIRNVGTEIISNTVVTFTFDNAMQQFVSATPNPDATTGNSLTFNLGEILPFGIVNVDITMQTFQPPIVEGGDILNFTAVVLPDANDYTPEDNTYLLEQIVVNSFDPNDKLVLQGDEVHINDVHKYLDYIIRFQNTGTASAVNVRILDTLHPKLNYSTFTPISASHDYYIQITNENKVEFIFNNIHLPHQGANEPESHGFVAFKIKPKSDVQVGDIISGDAAIYFDFNPPIITDMVYTEIVDFMDVSDPEHIDNGVSVFPNPTKNLIHIKLNRSLLMKEVIMYNIQGHETLRSFEKDISIENLESGIYILKILTNQGNVFRKVVKQ